MGYNIGPKIGIDGEAQFRQQIKAINNEYKTLQAQTKALTAEYDKNGDQQGKLRTQSSQLEKQIDAQKRAIAEMEKALAQAENTTDANSDAVTTWRGKLYNAQATVSQLEKELADTEDQLRKVEEGIEDTGDAADDAGGAVSDFGSILSGNLVADVILDGLREAAELAKDIAVDSVDAAAGLRAESAQFAQTFGEMEQAATEALKALEKQTGISSTRIKGNYSTVYAFAKTMGSDSAQALDIASRAMTAAADSAAYYDKTVEEVTETIQAYIKGNYANDAALGIASTETTRNAAALERYGKAFKELTEAQKVDTLLAMVEAGNKASGAMGQAAREAGEWTNVTGELEDAQRQLLAVIGEPILEAAIPITQELTQAMRELAEVNPSDQLRRNLEGFADTLEETEQAFNKTKFATIGTATVAEQYVRRLQQLEEAGLNTAQAHAEYEALVAKLNAVIPELNVSIDQQTGLINQNTMALLADVEAWKNAAINQAMYSKLSGQLEAYGEAQVALAEAEKQRQAAEARQEEDLQTLAATLGVVGAAYIKTSVIANEYLPGLGDTTVYEVYDEADNKLATLHDTMLQADSEAVKLAKSYNKNLSSLMNLDAEIAEGKELISGYESEMEAMTELMGDYQEQTEDTAEAEKKQQQAIADTQAALLVLKEAYKTARESTRSMLDSAIGLWDSMATKSEWSAKKVLENWRSQMKAYDAYTANLQKAQEIGLDEAIIKALSDGSQESMQILDAMVNQSKYTVGEINAAFTDLGLAKDSTTDMLMSMDESLREGYDQLVADARKAGVEIVDGIAQAIRDNAHKIGEELQAGAGIDGTAFQSDAEDLGGLISNWQQTNDSGRKVQTAGNINKIFNFNITQLPGENGEELAERIADKIANDAQWKGDGLGG